MAEFLESKTPFFLEVTARKARSVGEKFFLEAREPRFPQCHSRVQTLPTLNVRLAKKKGFFVVYYKVL